MSQANVINPPQAPRTMVLTDTTGVHAVTTDGNGNLNVNVQAGGGGGGSNPSASPTGSPVPADADYIGAKDQSGNLVGLKTDASGNLNVNLAAGTITGGNAAAAATGAPVPASADFTGFKDVSGNLVGVSAANPLPVSASVSFSDPAEGVPGSPVPADAIQIGGSDGTNLRAVATDASGQVKVLIQNSPAVTVSNLPATQPVSGTVAVSNLPATQPVSGTVAVSNFPATQPVSAAALPLPSGASTDATVANPQVSPGTTSAPTKIDIMGGKTSDVTPQYQPLPLTNSGAAVKTDGSATTQPVSGTVSVSNLPATQAVSGTVGVNNFPATQPVSGTVAVSNFPATQPVSAASLPLPTGAAADASVTNPQVTSGTTSAPAKVLVVAGKTSDVTPQYQPLPLTAAGAAVKTDGSATTQPVSGTVGVNNFPATQAVSGTVTGNQGTPAVVANAWPVKVTDGTNAVTVAALTNSKALAVEIVDGAGTQITSFGGGTQFADNAVSGATPTGTLSMGWDSANSKIRALKVDASQNLDVNVQAGTVTANAGTNLNTSALALDATLTGGTQKTKLVDSGGTNAATVKAASTAAVATDPALVVAVSPNNPVAVTNTGTFATQSTLAAETTKVIGTVNVSAGQTIAVTGTVTDNQGTPNTAANAWPTKITDGTNVSAVKAASTAAAATDPALVVAVSPNNSVAVIQATGTNLHTVIDAGANIIGKVDLLGNTGATLDSTVGAATAPTNALATSNVYQTVVPALTAGQAVAQQCDTTGSQFVNATGRSATYRMAVKSFTPVASATSPTFSIQGSASKTVRILRIVVTTSCLTGTATPFKSDLILQKYSALTGGTTGSTPVGTLMDSGNAAQTAICLQYSAVPTTATAIGGLTAAELIQMITPTASLNGITRNEFDFGDKNGQGLVLRGTSQFLGISINPLGATPLMSVWIEWVEDNS